MFQLTQKLTTDSDKQKLLGSMEEITKHIMRVIANSSETVEDKETLSDFMCFILDVLDIEKERIRFETISRNKRTGRELSQTKVLH